MECEQGAVHRDRLRHDCCEKLAKLTKEFDALNLQVRELREALSMFVIGFEQRKSKLGLRWSLGFWEGIDPGLALVGGSEGIENSRFNAVIAYGAEDIQKAIAADASNFQKTLKEVNAEYGGVLKALATGASNPAGEVVEKRKCDCGCHAVNKSHSSCSACDCA
jgi:hypothetical protein